MSQLAINTADITSGLCQRLVSFASGIPLESGIKVPNQIDLLRLVVQTIVSTSHNICFPE